MDSLNDNMTVRCNVRHSNLIFEIINKIYSEALASCSGEQFKWGKVHFISVTIIELMMMLFT